MWSKPVELLEVRRRPVGRGRSRPRSTRATWPPSRAPAGPDALRPQAEAVPGVDRLRRRLLVVPVRERRRARRPRVPGVRVERPQLRQLVATAVAAAMSCASRFITGASSVGERRVVLRQQARRGQQVAVVEVVVVELVRPEGRREPDGRAGGLVVDDAPGVALRAPVRLRPLPQRVDRRGPQVRHDVRHAELLAEHDERRGAVQRLAAEVRVRRERRGAPRRPPSAPSTIAVRWSSRDAVEVERAAGRQRRREGRQRASPAHSSRSPYTLGYAPSPQSARSGWSPVRWCGMSHVGASATPPAVR